MITWRTPGIIASLLILCVIGAALAALLSAAPLPALGGMLADRYLQHVVAFSLGQALLSALLSVAFALPVARALFRRDFFGKTLLLRLCSMTLILPVLVAVFGLLSIYGREGGVSYLCRIVGIDYQFSPYGLAGILLAHVFFNLPLASRLLLQGLQQIPSEQRQLADQLAMRGWNLFKYLEWPWLKRQLVPAFVLIFMLCFTSFATVLTLGGGPQATTLELAIFQALSFDYDPGRAALLALLQMFCCATLIVISQKFTPYRTHNVSYRHSWQPVIISRWSALIDYTAISLLCLLILPPLIAVVFTGIGPQTLSALHDPALWYAVSLSLEIALAAGLVSIVLTMMLLWTAREYRLQGVGYWANYFEGISLIILAVPSIVLATGGFLLLNNTVGLPDTPAMLVIIVNALMAMPYASKLLESPMRDIASQYGSLCRSLDLTGWQRIRRIELIALRQPILQAFAFSALLSIGDFGVIALFGSQDFQTLPFYLYQQIGAYRSSQAAVTALLLLIICFVLFAVIEKLAERHAHS